MDLVPWILLGCATIGLVLCGLGISQTIRHTVCAPDRVADPRPPASAHLRPLKGDEEILAANLRTFSVQDYPSPIEIVFSTTEADDPAIAVARAVSAEHPQVPVRFVL